VRAGGIYETIWEVNGWGEEVRSTDGVGNTRRWEYDGAGQIVVLIDGYGNETKYEWNEIGKLAGVAYPEGNKETYEYNHLGMVEKIEDDEGMVWEGAYDEAGRLMKERGRPGIEKEYRYDALGRVVEVRSGGEVVERYRYEDRGRVLTYTDGNGGQFLQEKNGYGELVEETNRLGDRRKYEYDGEGRVVGLEQYSGKGISKEYRNGQGEETVTYQDGTTVVMIKDLGGNVVRAEGETGTIRYTYDAGGKLAEQYDEGSRERTVYEYDGAGRRVRMVSGNREVRYSYGKNNEVVSVRDIVQGLQVSYEYDRNGREVKRTYGNGVRQETRYDGAGRVVVVRELDSGNRLIRGEGYVYDEAGRRSHGVDGEGRVTKYEYDRQSRIAMVLYPWSEGKAEVDREEAEGAGLYFTVEKGSGERYTLGSSELGRLRGVMEQVRPGMGNVVSGVQMVWRESYEYDVNGNRVSKTTPWGRIVYGYDEENRLITKGDIKYTYDPDGNLLREAGVLREAIYEYNGQDRMASSVVTDRGTRTRVTSRYGYDGLGRRTVVQDSGGTMRTLYDGLSFEVIREGETYGDGSFTTRDSAGSMATVNRGTEGSRYRWVSEGMNELRTRAVGEYGEATERYRGIKVTLYGRGEAVGVVRSTSVGSGTVYLGKDRLGSVKTTTGTYGSVEGRYEYDVFGVPYAGDLTGGMDLGYTGKGYDVTTGLYNYGYRDYQPGVARFTTIDPVRDGVNWYAYVNNDPVNWIDPWGLDSALLTKKGSVFGAGHSAHAVQNYDAYGNVTGWTVYEVGPTSGSYLSSNPLDPIQAVLAGSLGGSSVGSTSGINAGIRAGTGTTLVGRAVASIVMVGVNTYTVGLNDFPDQFNRITVFNTTSEEDNLIRNASKQLGENFGKYNILTNNCSQYSAAALAAGGLKTTQFLVPNIAHTYADKNNESRIAYQCNK
jgi:RHS repeat-associated protein